MSATLTEDEIDIIQRLEQSGLRRTDATVAVVMTTREHARPRVELLHILRMYQGLESPGDVDGAVDRLIGNQWLEVKTSYDLTLVKQASNLRLLISQKVGVASFERKLKSIRQNIESCVEIVGSMTDEDSYLTFLGRLRQANTEILLPMLATSPDLQSIPILLARAAAGVRIRILLARPDLVARLRGESQRKTAEDAIRGWARQFKGIANVEIRLASRLTDTYLATCLLIDDTVLRLDVYDPHQHRSLQGTLLELRSERGTVWNVTRIVRRVFDEAWNSAIPIRRLGRFRRCLKKWWQLWLAIVFAVLAVFLYQKGDSATAQQYQVLSSILGSASGSFLVNWIVDSWGQFKEQVSLWMNL